VELQPELDFFIVCHANGVVGFYDICSGDLLSFLNEPSWSPDLQDIFTERYNKAKRAKKLYNKKQRKIENFTDSESGKSLGDETTSPREGFENISELPSSNKRRFKGGALGTRRNESDEKKRPKGPVLLSPKENFMPSGFNHPHTAKNGKQGLASPGEFTNRKDAFNIQSAGGVDSGDEMTLD